LFWDLGFGEAGAPAIIVAESSREMSMAGTSGEGLIDALMLGGAAERSRGVSLRAS
jgi:hypothetical protein